MGPSLGFVKDVFVCVCGAVLHIMVCSIAPLDQNCAIVGAKLHHWSCIAPMFLDTI